MSSTTSCGVGTKITSGLRSPRSICARGGAVERERRAGSEQQRDDQDGAAHGASRWGTGADYARTRCTRSRSGREGCRPAAGRHGLVHLGMVSGLLGLRGRHLRRPAPPAARSAPPRGRRCRAPRSGPRRSAASHRRSPRSRSRRRWGVHARIRVWRCVVMPATMQCPCPLDRCAAPGFAGFHSPAMVMSSTRIEPLRREPRTTVSRPTAAMPRNMSLRLPAMVISSTGYAISPFSTQ